MRKPWFPLSLLAAFFQSGCSVVLPETGGAPVGNSFLANSFVASLMQTEEPRIPELHRRPENDRFRLTLLLHPLDGGPRRDVPLARGLKLGDFFHGARFLGDDGRLLWFHAHKTMAYDYRAGRLLSGSELPPNGEPRRSRMEDGRDPYSYLDRTTKLGAGLNRPALLLDTTRTKPVRLAEPDSVLLTSRTGETMQLSRVTAAGETLWTASTGLRDLRQILPGPTHTVFTGEAPPRVPDEFRPVTVVIVNNRTGAVVSHALDTRN